MARPGSLGHPELSKAGRCVALAAAGWLPPALACSFLLPPVGSSTAVPSCFQLKAVLLGLPEALGLAAPGAVSPLLPAAHQAVAAMAQLCAASTLGPPWAPASRPVLGWMPLWPQARRASSPLAWVEHGRRTPWGLMGFSSSLGLCFRTAVNGGDP